MEHKALISFSIPEVCFAWINLFILFLIAKKFLFKPVKEMMLRREKEVKDIYSKAEEASEHAKLLEEECKQKLLAAKFEAARIINEAIANSELKAEEIVEQAKQKAMQILEKAQYQIKKEKDDALRSAYDEVADVVLITASKFLKKEMSMEDHKRVINEVLSDVMV
ncbi:MAG: F0F1 ATP synthase subunit B [Oscillospiraceae bacterium]|nr:F0F1 ATP synthase subunit B [Oscillospiraceae bacterium]